MIAIGGSLVGLVGSALQETMRAGIMGPFVGGPIIEEALKPSGVYLLLVRYPQALSGRVYTALLAALAGLGFGLVENVLYLSVYFPEHSHQLVVLRYTAGLALHATASFIFGFGINQKLVAAVKGEIPLFAANKRFFVAAIGLHSAYNIAAFTFLRDIR